ncbi:hypothetical protein [Streptomyces sp. MUM 16J]|uniref:hypothetical protein n=1 Tax=Streptomyces sp. MUM 16J TaxID=2791988 RepID=UPI001F032EFE|nr:hypothetical protein [Streptomyces sp. MUM 16J]MCH0559174.1 hypothetical protein [Streptomyces sp. MUM 16J]
MFQLAALLDGSGALDLIGAELAHRPGPAGLAPRTVLTGLLLAIHYTGKATLAEAWRILTFCLSPTAQQRLGIQPGETTGPSAQLALSRRIYRSFDRVTTALDPARCDRRRRLPLDQAEPFAAAWGDNDAEHIRKKNVLQQICTALVTATIRIARRCGALKHWRGDVGIDATALASWHKPPSTKRHLASVDLAAGWHFSGGYREPTFGLSGHLALAAVSRPRSGRTAQIALGLVVDHPGHRTGSNAITLLTPLTVLQLPVGTLAVDRLYTDARPETFALPARALGYRLALDYKQDQRGIQGTHRGAVMIDGTLTCPFIPPALANATHRLDDKAVRQPDELTQARIDNRKPYSLHLKQGPDDAGAIRLACPATGTSPTINCPRRPADRTTPRTLDLTDPRQRRAHPAARPTVTAPDHPADHLPDICRQQSITIHPGDLGTTEKFRQDLPYLTDTWRDTFKVVRAQNEGINGQLKGHKVDISEPKNQLAHGRVAQTLLVALMVTIANLTILDTFCQTTRGEHLPATAYEEPVPAEPDPPAPQPTGRPPPWTPR